MVRRREQVLVREEQVICVEMKVKEECVDGDV